MEIIEKPTSLDYKESWILENEAKKRKILLKVIVKGILTSLLQNVGTIPPPLLIFLQKFSKKGQFIPNKFLTPYEINRVDYDNYGAFLELDDK